MSTHEKLNQPVDEFNRIIYFLAKGRVNESINLFTIKGEASEGPTKFSSFICFYGMIDASMMNIETYTSDNSSTTDLYDEVLGIELSERIKSLGVKDTLAGDINAANLADNGLPSVIIGFGEYIETGEKHVSMFATTEVSPERALGNVKTKLQEQKNNFN